jgi:predicted DNA-binding transcriptional regulator YafY
MNEYMDLLAGVSFEPMAITLETGSNVVAIQVPDRSVRPEVVREVVNACRRNTSIKIIYASMANPALHERIISPHTVVYTGFRWYVRAYCHKRQEYRDFILSRIDRTPQPVSASAPTVEEDTQWSETIRLSLIPNENLSDAQKALVEKDYCMPDGRMDITVRKALAHYTLQRYQAAISDKEIAFKDQYSLQLLKADRKKLAHFVFEGENNG